MATIAPISSEHKALDKPKLIAKAPKKSDLEFRKTPPQVAISGLPREAPSELHFTQFANGGVQITSLIICGLGGLILTSKSFKMTNSEMEDLEVRVVILPDKLVLEIIKLFAVLKLMVLS